MALGQESTSITIVANPRPPHRAVISGCTMHKHGSSTAAFTKNGHDHSSMVDALACLKGVSSLIIEEEGSRHVGRKKRRFFYAIQRASL
jgi:hypothetical protein